MGVCASGRYNFSTLGTAKTLLKTEAVVLRTLLSRLIIVAIFVGLCGTAQAQQRVRISTLEEIAENFVQVPCANGDRLKSVTALFERMQAAPSEISIDKLPGVTNLVARHPGTSQETIVIGAHYDLAEFGCGAV